MNSNEVKQCPKCGAQMVEKTFTADAEPSSVSPKLYGLYIVCLQCGYAQPVPNGSLD